MGTEIEIIKPNLVGLAEPKHAPRLKAILIKDPFHPFDAKSRYEDWFDIDDDRSLLYYRNVLLPIDIDVTTSLNGTVISKDRLAITYIKENDCVMFLPNIGGSTLRSIVRALAFVAIAVAAVVVASTIGGVLGILAAMAINIIGGMVVNALLPPPKARKPDLGIGQTAGGARSGTAAAVQPNFWSSAANTEQQGTPVPWVYGQVRVGGNIIDSNLDSQWASNIQYVNAIVCLSEGPCQRIAYIEVNNQPIENYNPNPFTIWSQNGWNVQDPIPIPKGTVVEYSQNVKITNSLWDWVETQGDAFDGIEIEVTFDQGLFGLDQTTGNTISATAGVCVGIQKVSGGAGIYWISGTGQYFQPNGVGFIPENAVEYLTQATTATYRYSWLRWSMPEGRGQYKVVVVRFCRQESTTTYYNNFSFTALREIYSDNFTYPNKAVLGVRALTSSLSSNFSITALVDGRIVAVYDSTVKKWFLRHGQIPAWCAYDVLTQPVFRFAPERGPGYAGAPYTTYGDPWDDGTLCPYVIRYRGMQPANLPTQNWSDFADWCEGTDESTGRVPRYFTNGVFNGTTSPWEAALEIVTEAQGALFYDGQYVTVTVDRRTDVSRLYSIGSTSIGSFKGSFTGLEDRSGTIEVEFRNKYKSFQQDKLSVKDTSLDLNRDNKSTITLNFTTDPEQAYAFAMYRLRNNNYLIQSCSVDVDVDAISSTVGDVIELQSDIPQWGYGGLTTFSPNASTIYLDRDITVLQGITYQFEIQLLTGPEVRTVTNQSGVTNIITVASAFSAIPSPHSVWAFGAVSTTSKPFRVIGVTPLDDWKRTLQLVEYNESIYDITQPVIETNYSALSTGVKSVAGLSARGGTMRDNVHGTTSVFIDVSFIIPNPTFAYADIWYQSDKQQQWVYNGRALTNVYRIFNIESNATYTIKAVAHTYFASEEFASAPTFQVYIAGTTGSPDMVQNFLATPATGGLLLQWDASLTGNVSYYAIRYNTSETGLWENSTDVLHVPDPANSCTLPAAQTGLYMIKSVSRGNQECAVAVAAYVTIPTVIDYQSGHSVVQGPVWTGYTSGMYVQGNVLYLNTGAPGQPAPGSTDTKYIMVNDRIKMYENHSLQGSFGGVIKVAPIERLNMYQWGAVSITGGGGGGGTFGTDIFGDDFETIDFTKWTVKTDPLGLFTIQPAPAAGYGNYSARFSNTGSGGNAYVSRTFAQDYTNVWAKLELFISDLPYGTEFGLCTFWRFRTLAGQDVMDISLHDADGDSNMETVLVRYKDDSGVWNVLSWDQNSPDFNTGVWHTYKLNWQKGGNVSWYTEGNLITYVNPAPTSSITGIGSVQIGAIDNNFTSAFYLYFDLARVREDESFSGTYPY